MVVETTFMSDSITLRINEIFYSLQGETRTVGIPTVFVRLTGCPLRCQYCDTAYAFHKGDILAQDEVLARVAGYNARYVTVTGGEPLAQPNCISLLEKLCDEGYEVSLETGGAMSIENVDSRVVTVLDLKTPGSNECDRNLESNIKFLKPKEAFRSIPHASPCEVLAKKFSKNLIPFK